MIRKHFLRTSLIVGCIFMTLMAFAQWTPTQGPTYHRNVGAFIEANDTVFCLLNDYGIFQTINNGQLWTHGPPLNPYTPFNDHTKTFFKQGANLYCTYDEKVYISNNNGHSWYSWTFPNAYNLSSVAALGNVVIICCNSDIYSTSNGINGNWDLDSTGLGWSQMCSVSVLGNKVLGGSNNSLYISSDTCHHWTKITGTPNFGRAEKIKVYDGRWFIVGSSGIIMSQDTGQTWTVISNITTSGDLHAEGDTLYICNSYYSFQYTGIHKSTNLGVTWTDISQSLPSLFVISVFKHNGILYAGTYNHGILTSSDEGLTWQDATLGFPKVSTSSMAMQGNRLLAGTYGDMLQYSDDQGVHWNKINYTGYSDGYGDIMDIAVKDDTILLADLVFGTYLSYNNGINWTNVLPSTAYFGSCGVAIKGNKWYATCDSALFLSTDKGVSWNPISIYLPGTIRKLLVVQDTILYGTNDGFVFKSFDGGLSWQQMSTLGPHPISFITLYNKTIFTAASYGIFKANVDSLIFFESDSGIGYKQVNCMMPYGNMLIAGSGDKISVSIDAGISWFSAGIGLPPVWPASNRDVWSLTYDSTYFYAGFYQDGIFRVPKSQLLLLTGLNTPSSSPEYTIYPNPGNGRYRIDNLNNGNNLIEVYNQQGELILQSQSQSVTTEIDLTAKADGLYFLRITSSKRSSVFKLFKTQ